MKMVRGIVLAVLGVFAFASPVAAQSGPQFRVYFDFQIKNLTAAADDTVAAAEQQAVAAGATQIDLVGNADTLEKHPGPLSLARAKAVKAALLRHGLPKSVKVTVKGDGTAHPFVPTGPGTREPMNRFVAVSFH
jgi:OmpA-OmpF porin, OOP family